MNKRLQKWAAASLLFLFALTFPKLSISQESNQPAANQSGFKEEATDGDKLSLDELKARRASLESSGDLGESVKKNVLRYLDTAIRFREKDVRPMERIMEIADRKAAIQVTTTGVHLARRIGEALSRSYKGQYSFQYGDGEKSLRVFWER